MRYFPYGSYQVYYESHSAGRPLILLHGNTASGRMFDPIIPVLAEKYRVITMDFLGCGRSDRIATWPSDLWYEWANQVRALCEHLGLGEVYLVGASGGALAAINAALEYPQLVRAVAADSFAGIGADPAITNDIQAGRTQAKQSTDSAPICGPSMARIGSRCSTRIRRLSFAMRGKLGPIFIGLCLKCRFPCC